MNDGKKTKEQLINEINQLRRQLAGFRTMDDRCTPSHCLLNKYQTIFETTSTAMIIVDEDMTINLANHEFEKLSGCSKTEIEGKISWEIFVPFREHLDTMIAYHQVRRISPRAVPRNYEFKFKDKWGNLKDIYATFAMIEGTTQSIASFLDITERKQSEEILKLNEQRLEALLQLSHMTGMPLQKITDYALEEGVRLTKSRFGYLAFANPDGTELTMHSWSKTTIQQCKVPETPIVYTLDKMGLWGEPLRQRKPVIINDYDAPNPLKKGYPPGHIKLIRHMSVPVFDGTRICAVAGVANKSEDYDQADVRQLSLLMQGMMRLIQTMESEQRFQDLSENALTGISIVQKGRVVYRNREMMRLLSNVQSPPDRFLLEKVHPDDLVRFQTFFDRLSSGKTRTANMEFRFLIQEPSGKRMTVKWVYCRATIITYKGEEAILVNMMDITRVKEIDSRMRIQDKMASLGRVAAGIAHEIRNPLSGINIYLNILEKQCGKGGYDKKTKEIIKNLQSASNKIESVIKRVMDFSKPGEPRLMVDDINRPLLEAVDLSSVSLRKSGVELLIEIDENLPAVYLNAQLIEELVLNLIVNAVDAMKHMDGVKKITISSSCKNSDICVSIVDSGPGIPDHLKEKIFEPFYTTKHDSSGIGLSICQRIAADHGGTLEVKTGPRRGAEFILKIPIIRRKDL